MVRRWGMALVLSIAAHLTVVGGIVAALMVSGLTFSAPVDVEIAGMSLDEVRDLPLGPPPSVADRPGARPPAPRRRPPAPAQDEGELAGKDDSRDRAADEPAPDDGTPRATSLRQYGPEGSRVTVLLRVDRLRGTAYAPALDALLGRLPDRRDLLEGTGLDLYKDFDALLIATPNPLDYTVTFLAARHRLRDAELRAALERGAKATGRVLTWRTEGRRPFAERHARAGGVGATGAPGASRDDRLIVLPAPGLVVVTPPTYRSLLLASMRPRPARPPAPVSRADAGADAGAASARAGAAPDDTGASEPQWGALLRRLDAEDGIMPADTVALVSAVDYFSARSLRRGAAGAPAAPAAGGTGTVWGLPVPKVLTASIGVQPAPFLDVQADMETEEQASAWEAAWPTLHKQLRSNFYVGVSGFGPLVARAELTREGTRVHLREDATADETLKLLDMAARFLGVGPVATP